MTTTTVDRAGRSASTSVTEYDEARRAQARAAGRPVERTLAPGIFGEPKVGEPVDIAMVWTDESGALSYFCAKDSRVATRVTVRALDRALSLPRQEDDDDRGDEYDGDYTPRRLVVSDHATLRRLMAWVNVAAAAAADDDFVAASVHRRMAVASRLVASTRLIVLTRALSRKFWLGSQYDPEDFGAWRRAFSFGSGATMLSVMSGLVDLACEGRVWGEWARKAFNSESYALLSAAYPGLSSAVATFRRIEGADNAVRAIYTTDPLLRDRALADGSVSSLRILTSTQASFTASVSTPFKLRAGKRVLLIDPAWDDTGGWAETQLQSVTVARVADQDTLIAQVASSEHRSRSNLRAIINAGLLGPGRTLLITEAPYLPFDGNTTKANRWTQPAAVRIDADKASGRPRRDIPLDVIVAGSPTV